MTGGTVTEFDIFSDSRGRAKGGDESQRERNIQWERVTSVFLFEISSSVSERALGFESDFIFLIFEKTILLE